MRKIIKDIRETEAELDEATSKLRAAQRKAGACGDPDRLSDLQAEIAEHEFDIAGIKGHLRGLYDRRYPNAFFVEF